MFPIKPLIVLFYALFLFTAVCGCEPPSDVATTGQAFTCVGHNPFGGCVSWMPDLTPTAPNFGALPAVRCASGYSAAPDRKVKVWTSVNFGGWCEILSPGNYATLGDWHHAAGSGGDATELRIRSMSIGAATSTLWYNDEGGLMDGYNGPTFNWLPDMLEQRIAQAIIAGIP
jgi:hypothetical protein